MQEPGTSAGVRTPGKPGDAALPVPGERTAAARSRQEMEAELADIAQFPHMNPGPVLRLNREGTILLVNRAARAAFGGDELVGDSWQARCPGMTPAVWSTVLDGDRDDLMHEADVGEAVFAFVHVRAADRHTIFVFGNDITARRRAEAELYELARFPDMNPGPVLRMDVDGTVLLANRAARTVFGDAMDGADWRQLYRPAGARWPEILGSSDVVNIEARLGGHDYVFSHRMDPHTQLVFAYGYDVSEQRQAEQALRQSEKMATLGTLAAGVAHELNNPAAATKRAADHLTEALANLESSRLKLAQLGAAATAHSALADLEQRARTHAESHVTMDAIDRADREADLEEWLEDRGHDDACDFAPALVDQDLTPEDLERLASVLEPRALEPALRWSAALFAVHRLTLEIGEGSKRISETVKALKAYSYLGQAPQRQRVNLHEDLDNTLVILRHKLKQGIDVHRDYADDMPPVPAYGGELNHVWTNLLDNAADAAGPGGAITISTRPDGGWAVVTISDNGHGIPEDVQPRIFEQFFTTKSAGKGTGLGLHTAYAIVTDKHHGTITVESRPGHTQFTVRLPLQE